MSDRPDSRMPVGCTPLQIEVLSVASIPVMALRGSCTMDFAAEIARRLAQLTSEPHTVLVIDMSGLDFIESSGLGAIIAGYLKCRKRGADFRIAAARPPIRRIFEITRLDQLFKLYDDLEQALVLHPPV